MCTLSGNAYQVCWYTPFRYERCECGVHRQRRELKKLVDKRVHPATCSSWIQLAGQTSRQKPVPHAQLLLAPKSFMAPARSATFSSKTLGPLTLVLLRYAQ